MGGMSGMRKWWRMGILLGALCAAAGCGRPPLPSSAAPEEKTGVRVSGAAALEEVRRFVELGPKEPGTEGAARAAAQVAAACAVRPRQGFAPRRRFRTGR